jgi:hypothetical protein
MIAFRRSPITEWRRPPAGSESATEREVIAMSQDPPPSEAFAAPVGAATPAAEVPQPTPDYTPAPQDEPEVGEPVEPVAPPEQPTPADPTPGPQVPEPAGPEIDAPAD